MNPAVYAYLPPPQFGHPRAFIQNLMRFKPRFPVIFYSECTEYWKREVGDSVEMVQLRMSPEAAKPENGSMWPAVSNMCWLTAFRIALRKGHTHVIYLEEDCRVAGDGWDDVMWQEYAAANKPHAAAGTLVCFNPHTYNDRMRRAYDTLVARNWARNIPVASYGKPESAKPGDPQHPKVFPNGALGIYPTEMIERLFQVSRGNTIELARTMTAYDHELGERLRHEFDDAIFAHLVQLNSVYSTYKEQVNTIQDRKAMLVDKTRRIVAIHPVKEPWPGPTQQDLDAGSPVSVEVGGDTRPAQQVSVPVVVNTPIAPESPLNGPQNPVSGVGSGGSADTVSPASTPPTPSQGCQSNAGLSVADSRECIPGGVTVGETAGNTGRGREGDRSGSDAAPRTITQTEPERHDKLPSEVKGAEAPEGPGTGGNKPLMRNRQTNEGSPATSHTDGNTLQPVKRLRRGGKSKAETPGGTPATAAAPAAQQPAASSPAQSVPPSAIPRVDILIVTFAPDAWWLEQCLRSIAKYATGFGAVHVAYPNHDKAVFDALLERIWDSSTRLVCKISFHGYDETPAPLAHLDHNFRKCIADEFCPEADLIAHIDSDCFFREPVTPADYLVNGKPVLLIESFEYLKTAHPGRYYWKETVDRALNINATHETMCRHPAVHWRGMYRNFRERVEQVHSMSFKEYVLSCKPDRPCGFAEFPSLGAYAMKSRMFKEQYHFIDVTPGTGHARPHEKLLQFWSRQDPKLEQTIWIEGEMHKVIPADIIKQHLES